MKCFQTVDENQTNLGNSIWSSKWPLFSCNLLYFRNPVVFPELHVTSHFWTLWYVTRFPFRTEALTPPAVMQDSNYTFLWELSSAHGATSWNSWPPFPQLYQRPPISSGTKGWAPISIYENYKGPSHALVETCHSSLSPIQSCFFYQVFPSAL